MLAGSAGAFLLEKPMKNQCFWSQHGSACRQRVAAWLGRQEAWLSAHTRLPDCQTVRLPDCQIAGLPDGQIARLLDCQVARLPDC